MLLLYPFFLAYFMLIFFAKADTFAVLFFFFSWILKGFLLKNVIVSLGFPQVPLFFGFTSFNPPPVTRDYIGSFHLQQAKKM